DLLDVLVGADGDGGGGGIGGVLPVEDHVVGGERVGRLARDGLLQPPGDRAGGPGPALRLGAPGGGRPGGGPAGVRGRRRRRGAGRGRCASRPDPWGGWRSED